MTRGLENSCGGMFLDVTPQEMLTDTTSGGLSAQVVSATALEEKQKMLTAAWESLCAQAKARGEVLEASFEEKKFISNVYVQCVCV